MFNNSRLKKILVTALTLVMVLGTVVVAAESIYTKQLTATFGRIRFNVGGKDVTQQIESKYGTPAFVTDDGRSYVPVRAIADLMGLDVDYDNNTHTVKLTDLKSEKYEKDLKAKDAEISKLKKEIADLKQNVVEETSLETLEKKLNKDFGTYKNVDFNISLKETSSSIDVSVTVDLRTSAQQSNWNKLTNNDKKYYVEDLVGDITTEFKNIKITGSIYNNNTKRDLLTFNKNKGSSTVTISYKGTSSGRDSYYYDDILYDAEDHLDYYFSRIAYVTNINIREGSNGQIYGTIDIEEDRYYIPSDGEIENAFYDAEKDLIRDYGSGVYLDIELYLNDRPHGIYYDGRFK
ncbi:MAG: hypothetical protein GX053_10600 [Tissierella sp.]|nr:hypothetical protein [Tissierella sp.]